MGDTYIEYYTKKEDAFKRFKYSCNYCFNYIPYYYDKMEHCACNHRIKEILIEIWPDMYETFWVRKLGGCEDFVLKNKTE